MRTLRLLRRIRYFILVMPDLRCPILGDWWESPWSLNGMLIHAPCVIHGAAWHYHLLIKVSSVLEPVVVFTRKSTGAIHHELLLLVILHTMDPQYQLGVHFPWSHSITGPFSMVPQYRGSISHAQVSILVCNTAGGGYGMSWGNNMEDWKSLILWNNLLRFYV